MKTWVSEPNDFMICKNCGHFLRKDKDFDYWVHAGYGKGQCSNAEPTIKIMDVYEVCEGGKDAS